jgi:hypothetical protein
LSWFGPVGVLSSFTVFVDVVCAFINEMTNKEKINKAAVFLILEILWAEDKLI